MTVDSGLEFKELLRQKNIPRREIRIISSNNHGNKLLSSTLTVVNAHIMIFFRWYVTVYKVHQKWHWNACLCLVMAVIISFVFAALQLELSFPVDFDENNQHPLLFILYVHPLFSNLLFLIHWQINTNTYSTREMAWKPTKPASDLKDTKSKEKPNPIQLLRKFVICLLVHWYRSYRNNRECTIMV